MLTLAPQATLRMNVARRAFVLHRRQAVRLQARWRGAQARRAVAALRAYRRRTVAATRLQTR
ncbi:MAG: hypothetical protein ACK4YT_14105, partial [Sphingomonas sp.]